MVVCQNAYTMNSLKRGMVSDGIQNEFIIMKALINRSI